jgi:protein-tyrosine kinase
MSRISDALARASRAIPIEPEDVTPAASNPEALVGVDPVESVMHAELFPTEVSDTGTAPRAAAAVAPERTIAESSSVAADMARELAAAQADPDVFEKLVIGPLPASSLEQYRRLAAALHQAHQNTGFRVVMIASAVAGEGKTLTSANLALTLSESYRKRVLLIDADLRRPSIHKVFGLPNLDGLTDALKSGDGRKVCTQAISSTLSVITAGRPDTEQMAHLSSSRMRQLIQEAMEIHDWVVLDTPPVALLPDAKLLAAMVDGALLVVRAGATPYPIVQRAIQAIGPERILGTILNGADASAVAGHHYYEGYYTYEAPRRKKSWWRRRRLDERSVSQKPPDAAGSALAE